MENTLFQWVLDLPLLIASFGSWLTTNLGNTNWTPLGIIGVGGGAILIVIIGVHVVRLFV